MSKLQLQKIAVWLAGIMASRQAGCWLTGLLAG